MYLDKVLGRHIVPDSVMRFAIRCILYHKRKKERISSVENHSAYISNFIENLKCQPIAVNTPDANRQHYELPPAFFEKILGRRLKYSCCYWPDKTPVKKASAHLDRAEEEMLALTCERAELSDGQDILELGCGWGTLCLYAAEKFANSRITAVSNSRSQVEYIKSLAGERGLANLQVLTADINHFQTEKKYDRLVSVEMFEHMRNYEALMKKVAAMIKPGGKLFVHIFTHHTHPFLYENRSERDWMTRYFFLGGTMPSRDLLHYFTGPLQLEKQWALSGTHYRKTLEAWLQKMDRQKEAIMPIFRKTYGCAEAEKWWNYWRLFFLSCAEFFAFRGGNEWFISHYRFVLPHPSPADI